jgi:hypothetical protein
MKLKLNTLDDFKQFNIRIPELLKAELTQLRERCEHERLDFNAAITATLRAFAVSLRAELNGRNRATASKIASATDSNPLAKSLAEPLTNGGVK